MIDLVMFEGDSSVAARYSTRQTSTPRSRDSKSSVARPAAGKRRKPSGRRFETHFAARDWAAMAEMLADDISIDDRRRVVNAGLRHGRDAEIASMRAMADLGSHET